MTGCETGKGLHSSLAVSYPSQAHDKQHTHTPLTSLRLATTKHSKAAPKALRIHMQRFLRHVPPTVTDHSLWFHQDLAREYVPLGEHTQLRVIKRA